jgi:hypothetical protein
MSERHNAEKEFEKNGITKRLAVDGSVYIEKAGVYIYIVGANGANIY